MCELYLKFRPQKRNYLRSNPIAFALYLKEISVKGTQTTDEILSHSHMISVIHKIGPRSEQISHIYVIYARGIWGIAAIFNFQKSQMQHLQTRFAYQKLPCSDSNLFI